jgi:hypothetical protein
LSRHILSLFFLCGLWIAGASAQTNFSRFNIDAGGGFAIGRGDVANFTGTSYNGVVGGGLNLSRKFGVNAEYMYYNLAFKDNVINQQSLPGAKGHLQSVTLNGIYTYPLHNRWGVYGIGGFGWYQRSVSARSEVLSAGTACQPAWIWWGITCTNGHSGFVSPPGQTLSSRTLDAIGFDYGGGITYRLPFAHHAKLFAEGRYHRAYTSDVETIVFPVTFGLRW